MKYIHFTNEQKELANSVMLEDFLRCKGEHLIKSGKEKRLKSDKSITIYKNEWFDHSKNTGGYAIDFVKMFYGLSYPQAVSELLGTSNIGHRNFDEPEAVKDFSLPPQNNTTKKIYAYMTKHRGISPSVFNFFVNQGLIYESVERIGVKDYNNIVFVGKDNENNPKHAHKRSIYSSGKRFVQNISGSSPKDSFNFLGGSDRLYVFESPIDMLSFISLHEKTNWKSHNYVALCGLSSKAMIEQVKSNINHVVLCLDNDNAGDIAFEKFENLLKDVKVSRITPDNKDFNEDLVYSQKKIEMGMVM